MFGVGVGANPRGRGWVCLSGGVWGCRMSCIEPGLLSGKVTNGGAFCYKGVHRVGFARVGHPWRGSSHCESRARPTKVI